MNPVLPSHPAQDTVSASAEYRPATADRPLPPRRPPHGVTGPGPDRARHTPRSGPAPGGPVAARGCSGHGRAAPAQDAEEARPGQRAGLRFGVLGPVEVLRADGSRCDLGPRQRRVLLVRLLAENGRPVTLERLCDDVWSGRPPSGAISAVHAHVSRLRGTLEPERARHERPRVLLSGPYGYALHVPAAARDTVRFEELVERARSLLAEGRPEAARQHVDRAMRLWRGPALADARDHSFAAREIGRWEEAAHSAREVRIAALLASGGHGEAVLDARALAEDEPLRESAWALLMRALHQAGRTAEALLEFERMRGVLGRDLALEPSPALRALRSAIQRHSPDLAPRQPGWAVQPLPAAG